MPDFIISCMLPNKPLIVGWVATSKHFPVIIQLIPIAGGNDVGTSHGGPIAPTICYDALFELGVLNARPSPRSTGQSNVHRRGCLGLGFFSLHLGSYFCHCFFGLPLSFNFFCFLSFSFSLCSFFLLCLAAFSFCFFSLLLLGTSFSFFSCSFFLLCLAAFSFFFLLRLVAFSFFSL